MKFNYKLQRLCGAYYGHNVSTTTTAMTTGGSMWSGSNLVYDSTGNLLISAVSNRVQVVDLRSHSVRTLPVEARSSIRCLALSPDDALLLSIDVKNYAMLINFRRGVVLHRFRFKRRVREVRFSPDGRYIAATHGKHVQVWCTPASYAKEFAPLALHRTYTGQADDVTCLSWSEDSTVLAAGSRDNTVRIWTVNTIRNYEPVTLAGHRRPLVGVFLGCGGSGSGIDERIDGCYSVSEDGALISWKCQYQDGATVGAAAATDDDDGDAEDPMQGVGDEAVDFFSGGVAAAPAVPNHPVGGGETLSQAHGLVQATWSVGSRHFFQQEGTTVTACHYCERGQLLAVGFSSGLFGLYEMPSVANIHTLSVGSGQLVKTCVLNLSGDWLALACPMSQQLLVWEWRSEQHVLKQRGHAAGMRCMAYSGDGAVIATGGEDGKVKLWNSGSGFCYVTFEKSHTAPISAVAFANASVVLSAGLDGTVRAHDLHRYRTFRTLTTPKPVQLTSLAADPAGEIVVAGSLDPFHVYAWNLQTGRLLDVYTGHAGPVSGLAFQATGGTLASSSWDGTVKLWDLYKTTVPTESLQHNADVVCVAFRPDGKELCAGTVAGLLCFWDAEHSKLKYELDGRRDIAGGRKINDRMTADNNAASRYFTSVCYSADGSCVLAGGNSKYVCIYEVSQQMLLKKFQVTFNRSLDGVLDELNSKNLGASGPIDDHANDSDDDNQAGHYYGALRLPGARRGDDGSRTSRVEVLTRQVAFSVTGREWAAVSGEGLHVYSLDEDMIFDPISLTESITPAAVESRSSAGQHGAALRMALHLNEFRLVRDVLEKTPYRSIPHVVRSVGPEHLERLMHAVAVVTAESPHVQFYVEWCLQLLQQHGMHVDRHRGTFLRALRAMNKAVQTRHDELAAVGNDNKYALEFVHSHGELLLSDVKGDNCASSS